MFRQSTTQERAVLSTSTRLSFNSNSTARKLVRAMVSSRLLVFAKQRRALFSKLCTEKTARPREDAAKSLPVLSYVEGSLDTMSGSCAQLCG